MSCLWKHKITPNQSEVSYVFVFKSSINLPAVAEKYFLRRKHLFGVQFMFSKLGLKKENLFIIFNQSRHKRNNWLDHIFKVRICSLKLRIT
jgi:hypothetical protein